MIIGIPVDKNSMDGKISSHFGRTDFFLVYNTEDKNKNFIENTAATSSGGAGIKAAQLLVDNKVDAIISPRLGKNAAEVVNAQNISLYQSTNGTIEDNIQALKDGKLSLLNEIHEGFHGNGRK